LQSPDVSIQIKSPLPNVFGDEASRTQCIASLLTNAVKFVAPGVKPQLRIRAEAAAERVVLWFEDKGIGIPPKDQERIFGIFERVNAPS
jgi:signal transduction histidine kinase